MDWTAVGLKDDVPPGVAVPSRIDDTDLAIWCTSTGTYHAWSDRCPHRGMRLSHGFVRGDRLACIYHGWQYDESGSCDYIPAHPELEPPATICVPTYPCVEQGGVIWSALGAPTGSPPDVAGRRAVRSIGIACSAGAVAAHFGVSETAVILPPSDFDVALALQPSGADACVVHALAAPDRERKDVSRWLETLRRDLEKAAA